MRQRSCSTRCGGIVPVITGFTAIALSLLTPLAYAGGYLGVSNVGGVGVAWKWTASPVVLNYDQGPFSATLTNAQGDTLATNAISKWNSTNIPTCSLTFSQGADLSADHGNGVSGDPQYDVVGDGVSPVIFDQTGLIVSTLFAGAEQVVIGFAGPQALIGTTIVEGQVVLNGRFLDGAASPTDLTQTQMEGVITHEVGHMLNLDHAQFNDAFALASLATYTPNYAGYPTMYPIAHADIQDPELDDQVWISSLYPAGSFATRTNITGVTNNFAGSLLNGVNVIARDAVTPTNAVSCVSGYLDPTPSVTADGVYKIPGLPASTRWVLDVEQIASGFTGGSSVGPIDPPLTLPGPVEFVNESGIESNTDSITRSTSFVTPSSGGTFTGADLRFNAAPSTTIVTEVDPGANFPSAAMPLTITPGTPLQVNGNAVQGEGGNVSFLAGDPVEDWYVIQPPAGVEINRIRLQPAAGDDADLYLVSYNQTGGSLNAPAVSLNIGNGVAETISGWYDSTIFGTGTAVGKVYIAVSTYTGSPGGNYTLTIEAALADRDALVVDDVSGGQINADSGSFTVTGRGFKNTGGVPTVTLSDSNLTVGTVTYVNSTQLNVAFTKGGGFAPGSTSLQVANQAASGGYAGRRASIPTVPVTVSGFSVE